MPLVSLAVTTEAWFASPKQPIGENESRTGGGESMGKRFQLDMHVIEAVWQSSEQQSPSNVQAPPDTTHVPDAGALAHACSGAAANTHRAGTKYFAFFTNWRRVVAGVSSGPVSSMCSRPKNRVKSRSCHPANLSESGPDALAKTRYPIITPRGARETPGT